VLLLLLLCMASLLFGCPVCVLAWPFFSLMDDPVSRPVAMTEKGEELLHYSLHALALLFSPPDRYETTQTTKQLNVNQCISLYIDCCSPTYITTLMLAISPPFINPSNRVY
jgi:hypothetical protein